MSNKNIDVVLMSIENKKRYSLCSSMGRLFDGVASLLGFWGRIWIMEMFYQKYIDV